MINNQLKDIIYNIQQAVNILIMHSVYKNTDINTKFIASHLHATIIRKRGDTSEHI